MGLGGKAMVAMEAGDDDKAGSSRDPFVARLLNPLRWDATCLDGDCALGAVAADSLCEWAAASQGHTACLLPSRFLGSGLSAGMLSWEDLPEVLPPHMAVIATLSAEHVRDVIVAGQTR